jgi:hypothetical protein
MNLKVAHLVSVQFGIFIGIICALVFFRFEYAGPRKVAKMRQPAKERTAPAEPLSGSEDHDADIVDDGSEPQPDEAVTKQRATALPNEYSPEAVERYRAEATRLYYQQIAPRRYASSSPANSSLAAVAPAYSEVAEEPAVAQTNNPAPETIAYVQPSEVIVYPPSGQFISFARPRPLFNRCRPAPRPGAFATNPHRRPDNWRFPRSRAVAQHPNPGAPQCPSPQRFTSRDKR